MSEKEVVCERIIKALDMCNINKTEEYFEIELPIILFFNQQLITLRLYPQDDGYYVSTLDTIFDEYPGYASTPCEEHYNAFIKDNPNYRYDIKRHEAYLYKKYSANHSARHAVDDFVKFLIHLDEYILNSYNKDEE